MQEHSYPMVQGQYAMADQVFGAFRQVLGFLAPGLNSQLGRRRALESELRELIAPHLPILMHRRAKLLENSGGWCDELESFMRTSLWPMLGADLDYAERNRTFVTLLIDVMIEREQRRTAQMNAVAMPLVSRFDASWAS